jgi:hypothetical protein
MPTFINYLVIVLLIDRKLHCMIWYTSTCSIIAMGLLYRLDDMVECVCYMGLGSNRCFMVGAALTDGHYRMDIISGVGYPRSCLVILLVSCMVVYNI